MLSEGLQDESGGEARILCRPSSLPDAKGCILSVNDGNTKLEMGESLSIPPSVIDAGKCIAVGTTEWEDHIERRRQKSASTIELLNAEHCKELEIDGALPVEARAGKGTTAGTLRFKGGMAAFVDSRDTKHHGNYKSYKDRSQKFFIISTKSNVLYIGCGWSSTCKLFAERLTFEVRMAEDTEQALAALADNIIEGSVGIEKVLELTQKNLNRIAHTDPPYEHAFGGILIGYGPNKEYKAYYVGLNKTELLLPRCLSDVPYCVYGSGACYAVNKLNELKVTPQGTAETSMDAIKHMILYTYLNTPGSGGPTNVFLLCDGQNLTVQPHKILDPVTVHLEYHGLLSDDIVLLLIDKTAAGKYDVLEQGITAWPGVLCTSRMASRKKYWLYRILCSGSQSASSVVANFMQNRAPSQYRDIEIHSSFEFVYIDVGGKMEMAYVGNCSKDLLQFISEYGD